MTSSDAPSLEAVARDVVEGLLEGCQVLDREWRYLYVNAAAVRQARRSREELLGRTLLECYPGVEATPLFEKLQECMQRRVPLRMENEFAYPDGARAWFELQFIPVPEGVCVLSLDVTDARLAAEALRRSEEQVRHMQKMEAVGRLAGSIAHDFNNILSVVLSYGRLLEGAMSPGDERLADVGEIVRAAERATTLTRQLLAFSHQRLAVPEVLDVNRLLSGMTGMLQRLAGESVELSLVLAPGAPRVRGVAGHLEQIVVNLVVNARDAMPDGGTLVVETTQVILDEEHAAQHVGVVPGPHVLLAVSDTGVGMSKEVQARIFEPFFTTKERGKGTGLGLATVFGIVRQWGGTVWVYSEPGQGSTFKVYLPETHDDERPAASRRMGQPREGRGERVLLVEDDPQLRDVVAAVLRRGGYRVTVAESGEAALAGLEGAAEPVQLLVTDVVMPRMSGGALVQRALRLPRPPRVLLMSGYTEDALVRHHVVEAGLPLMQKPITPEGILRKVREVLDAPPPSPPAESELNGSSSPS
jgi:PAS domain S-box-containing protein